MRLIDAEELKRAVRKKFPALPDRCEINELVNAAPAVEVVRCGECKYYDRRCFTCENDVLLIKIDDCGCHPPVRVDDDWFCADGERRESE